MFQRLKAWARKLKKESLVLRLAISDSRTPWYARWLGILVIAYALSPIDLIPDFIPVLGYVDDLLLLPVGIALTIKFIPDPVLAEARQKVEQGTTLDSSPNWFVGAIIFGLWLLTFGVALHYGVTHYHRW